MEPQKSANFQRNTHENGATKISKLLQKHKNGTTKIIRYSPVL